MIKRRIIEKIEKQYVLLVHYRNPYLYKAGSENYIISQINELEKKRISSIVVFPIKKYVFNREIQVWGVIYNQKLIYMKSIKKILILINVINTQSQCLGIFIHSIIGADLDELYQIVRFRNTVFVYLHDFCTCCLQYNLLKNDQFYCGSAELDKEKCHDCKYYEATKKRKKELKNFFSKIPGVKFISPSLTMKELWTEAYRDYKDQVIVIEHKRLSGQYEGNLQLIKQKEKIKIAFVGNGLFTKGWQTWIKVVNQLYEEGSAVNFFHFGNIPIEKPYIKHVSVSFLKDGENAMIHALRKYDIHAVVLFSIWPETYSYTYYESFASNCFVITTNNSGNIAKLVQANKNGVILENSTKSLYEFLRDENKLRKKINAYRLSGIKGPENLENNLDYLFLLHEEESQFIDVSNSKVTTNQIVEVFMEILYRIRYKLF